MNARRRHIRVPQPAMGRAQGHCGEMLQGRLGPGGPVALVTLPWPGMEATAWFAPAPGAPLLVRARGQGAHTPTVAESAARATLSHLGAKGWGGRLTLQNPAPVGGGAGSSSMDALAAVRAVSAAFAASLNPEVEASLMREAEGAVDPLMYDVPVLFASRRAQALAILPPAPRLLAVGGFDGPGRATAQAAPSDLDVTELAARLAAAFAARDLEGIGRVATESAAADQAMNAKPHWTEITMLAKESGALGVAVSHSGSSVALLFAPERDDPARRAQAALTEIGVARASLFQPFG